MDRWSCRTPVMVFFMILLKVSSETIEVRQALVQFMGNMNPGNAPGRDANWGWNSSSDPCIAQWKGVRCLNSSSVKKIVLDNFNLSGILDAKSLCATKSLAVFSLNNNNVGGNLAEEISNCSHLTHLYLSRNNFTGSLPSTLARLNNLKRLNISNNGFSGVLPDLQRISGLVTFRAEYNHLSGQIPDFDFSNLNDFNVSYNNFSGPIPDVNGHLNSSSFLGNPELCGLPLTNACPTPPSPTPSTPKHKHSSIKQYLIYSGYGILALVFILLLLYKAIKVKKNKDGGKRSSGLEIVSSKPTSTSSEFKPEESRSEFSLTSPENNGKASSLVVLSSPVVNGLKFEDLLRAPAELVGRGKHGTLYKVTLNPLVNVAVKRIKDWEISGDDFKSRMQRINEVKHPNVLPVVAYYCSQQEKLLVYEFQHNGSLSKYLNGSRNGETFDWGSRLNVAVRTANALAHMHEELQNDGISHGNLKSSNILLNKDMEPCISEYGLMVVENEDEEFITDTTSIDIDNNATRNLFKSDIYAFGLILLELLTGKLVQNRASDLAKWVHAVVREEWTAEVFDKVLISEGASEERMVNLLQVALKCINPSVDARPNSSQVAAVINAIKEDEEKSTFSSAEL
ncbi:OLC1v1013070C1 [Oldenlandia corymbosa var. corymbosa]|uniref:OLC1v1013070C1 n=1 Tax=Oldenlandia corymbosa var. corymbosa TaxID=529605 RepID=A0AAV1DXQ3_OLDCO|nr:OLC1v1013070C1 [Oldenlandia corymbosa var. corymbosa]